MSKESELRQALEKMIYQFGFRVVYNGKPAVYTGGMSALEGAFGALGWDDPHFLPEKGFTCEIQGCMEEIECGTHWGTMYLSLCSKHSQRAEEGKRRPPVKQYAKERESKRDPVTRMLP